MSHSLNIAFALMLALLAAGCAGGPQGGAAGAEGGQHIFRFNRTVQITPDSEFLTGSFPRINYVPATDRFAVTFGTKKSIVKAKAAGECKGAGFAYKEYTTGMEETGKQGFLLEFPGCEAGDMGSAMVGNDYYLVTMYTGLNSSSGWLVTKFDAANWSVLADRQVSLDGTHEANSDPGVAFADGRLDIFDQYNPDGIWQEGYQSHHNFFSPALEPLGRRILNDSRHISGASMMFVNGTYYIVSADSYSGDLVAIGYDSGWRYLGTKKLIGQAHWPQGIAFDAQRFYVAYLDTSQRNGTAFFPVYPNAHLAAFDREWNLLDDVAVTNFTRSEGRIAGRPWVILHDGRLYVSYDVDAKDPTSGEEGLAWQAYVSVYDIRPEGGATER